MTIYKLGNFWQVTVIDTVFFIINIFNFTSITIFCVQTV